MGLDMWLEGEYYSFPSSDKEKQVKWGEITETIVIPEVFKGVTRITVEIAYWRGAWFLKDWFEENCSFNKDDGAELEVEPKDIRKLVELCHEVIKDPLNAKTFLPNNNSNGKSDNPYDTYYFDAIKQTLEQLEPVLDKIAKLQEDDNYYISYQCIISW